MIGFSTFLMQVILIFFFFLHLGILVGFPLGNYSYNAKDGRKVTIKRRILSLIYMLLCVYIFTVYAQNGKVFIIGYSQGIVNISMIMASIFFGLDFFWVFASRSKKEKLLKAPLLLLVFICSVILLCL